MEENKFSVSAFLQAIYDGTILLKPMKAVYIITGLISFALPLLILVLICSGAANDFIGYKSDGFFTFLLWVALLGTLGITAYSAVIAFRLWIERSQDLQRVCDEATDNYGLILSAHYFRTLGEWYMVLLYALIAPSMFLGLCFFLGTIKDIDYTWSTVLALIVGIPLALFIIGWAINLFHRAISDFIMNFARMGNNISDMADIQRATI